MGKEHEVLQAAQDGNLSKLESLFTQRQSKVFAGYSNVCLRLCQHLSVAPLLN